VPFTLLKIEHNAFHFVNPEHDFHRCIIYFPKNKKELEVINDDHVEGSDKKSTFIFRKE